MSAVNVSTMSIGFLLVSLVTNRVSLEKECLSIFEVLNCLFNLADSCLDDEKGDSIKGNCFVLCRAFCSAVNLFDSSPQLGKICHLVDVLNKISPFLPFMYTDAFLYSVLAVQTRWGLFSSDRLVWPSRPVSLLVHVPRGICAV